MSDSFGRAALGRTGLDVSRLGLGFRWFRRRHFLLSRGLFGFFILETGLPVFKSPTVFSHLVFDGIGTTESGVGGRLRFLPCGDLRNAEHQCQEDRHAGDMRKMAFIHAFIIRPVVNAMQAGQ